MAIRKILIVEDSEILHRMYNLVLMRYTSQGTSVLHAYNGQDGLAKLSDHPDTDFIILDTDMPVMDGLEFLSHCMKEQTFQNIPVVIISTEGKQEDRLLGLKAGAKAYLTKPFQPMELYRLIELFASERGYNL